MKAKELKELSFLVLVFTLSIFTFSSCEDQAELEEIDASALISETDTFVTNTLESDCYTSLIYMREEEKLAHDVYVKMFELWDAKVFDNISKSETKHTNAVKGLLDFYEIDDPALPTIGEFANEELQELYNTLIVSGNSSYIDALKVGATIEEVDIIDLDEALEDCDVDTIITVYTHLRTGSTHHLKAFVANLTKQGVEYTPQFLTQEEYDKIINSSDSVNGDDNGVCRDSSAIEPITDEEAAGLIFMREEEKLAHDVYVNMYSLWSVKTFDNISKSETQHTEKVLSLLKLYNLKDPVLPGIGNFANQNLQALYDQLMTQGSDSLIAALIVGATIEEVDIQDLYTRMNQTENNTILNVYSSLEKGSEAHLRAFVSQLKLRGYDYEPQFLSEEDFNGIIDVD